MPDFCLMCAFFIILDFSSLKVLLQTAISHIYILTPRVKWLMFHPAVNIRKDER